MENTQQNNHDDVEPSHSLSDVDNQENDFEDGFGSNINQTSLLPPSPVPSANPSESLNLLSSSKEPKGMESGMHQSV